MPSVPEKCTTTPERRQVAIAPRVQGVSFLATISMKTRRPNKQPLAIVLTIRIGS